MPGKSYQSMEGLRSLDPGDKTTPSLPLAKEDIPLFGKEGLGEILEEYVRLIMDSLVIHISKCPPTTLV